MDNEFIEKLSKFFDDIVKLLTNLFESLSEHLGEIEDAKPLFD